MRGSVQLGNGKALSGKESESRRIAKTGFALEMHRADGLRYGDARLRVEVEEPSWATPCSELESTVSRGYGIAP